MILLPCFFFLEFNCIVILLNDVRVLLLLGTTTFFSVWIICIKKVLDKWSIISQTIKSKRYTITNELILLHLPLLLQQTNTTMTKMLHSNKKHQKRELSFQTLQLTLPMAVTKKNKTLPPFSRELPPKLLNCTIHLPPRPNSINPHIFKILQCQQW